MDGNIENRLPKDFIRELSDIPSVPSNLYADLSRAIDRKRMMVRTVWAIAASLLVMLTAMQAARYLHPKSSYSAEVAEELNGIKDYINSDVYKENDNSYAYYEETLYQE